MSHENEPNWTMSLTFSHPCCQSIHYNSDPMSALNFSRKKLGELIESVCQLVPDKQNTMTLDIGTGRTKRLFFFLLATDTSSNVY